MKRRPLLVAWAMLVLGLLVRAFAGALVGDQRPPGIVVEPFVVDVNRAGVQELTILPGVGRARAEAIVVERVRKGPFRCLGDLERVDGLGPAITGAFRGMVGFSMRSAASSGH